MIWLRRVISIPLVILLKSLFVSTFSVFTSINLLIDPDFIKQNLVRDGVYEIQVKRALANSITRTVDSWKNYQVHSSGESLDLDIDSKRLSDAMERSIPMDLIELRASNLTN